jgi:hypothetical protein
MREAIQSRRLRPLDRFVARGWRAADPVAPHDDYLCLAGAQQEITSSRQPATKQAHFPVEPLVPVVCGAASARPPV